MFTLTLITLLLFFSYLYEKITGTSSGTVANFCIIATMALSAGLVLYSLVIYFAKHNTLCSYKISRLPQIGITIYICILITMGYFSQAVEINNLIYSFFEGIAVILLAILIIIYWIFLFVNIKKHNSNIFLMMPLLVIEEIKGFTLAITYGLFIGIFFALVI